MVLCKKVMRRFIADGRLSNNIELLTCVDLTTSVLAWDLLWTVSAEKEEGSDSSKFLIKIAFLIWLFYVVA